MLRPQEKAFGISPRLTFGALYTTSYWGWVLAVKHYGRTLDGSGASLRCLRNPRPNGNKSMAEQCPGSGQSSITGFFQSLVPVDFLGEKDGSHLPPKELSADGELFEMASGNQKESNETTSRA